MKVRKQLIYNTLFLILGFHFLNNQFGNPISDFVLQFCPSEIEGYIVFAAESPDSVDNGYKFHYNVNGKRYYNKQMDFGTFVDDMENISPSNPAKHKVQYFSFIPSISKLKGSGYQSLSTYLFKSVFLLSLFYLGCIGLYIKYSYEDIKNLFNKEN